MFSWLGISAINPWLLAGALGVASPIIIHLLSKRRFKVIDWAAMDFLLDAERRNRRRIRLEHLLLLLLRCLAIALIALLVARPVREATGLAAAITPSIKTERIVLLDDSPSMRQRTESQDVFTRAKAALERFARTHATDRPDDTMSLVLTSDPSRRLIAGQHFERKRDEISRIIAALEPSDVAAQLDKALLGVEKELDEAEAAGAATLNHVIYLFTDLRRRDWTPAADTPKDRAIAAILERLGEKSQGVVIVDLGADQAENLSVTDIAPGEKSLVAGVRTRFEVVVTNHGTTTARDVQVTFTAGDAPPQVGYIDTIKPGATGSAPFSFTFAQAGSHTLVAELRPDALPADNARQYVARVRDGVRVLIVDGDPSSEYGRAETFFLDRALAPPGERASGNAVDTVTENQFAGVDLTPYQVVVLCNVYQVPAQQRDALARWVEGGGGLVFFLGDQIDDELYNRELYEEVPLLPARLDTIVGDELERDWAKPTPAAVMHPVMRIFEGLSNPFVNRVKVFRWWRVATGEDAAPDASVISTLDDADGSPMIVERSLGDGRVMLVTTSADGDWTSWPADESYPVTVLEMVRYLARRTAAEGNVPVGRPLTHPLDVSVYKAEATVIAPGTSESTTLQAAPVSAVDESADEAALDLAFRYERTANAGLYTLRLERFDATFDDVMFAVSIDPGEGDLLPMDRGVLTKLLDEANVQFAEDGGTLSDTGDGGRAELWPVVAALLLATLGVEQSLAWYFGRRR